jgi:hypothetical protein
MKSALAPTAKESAILFIVFSKRGVVKLQQPCWLAADQSLRARGSVHNGRGDTRFREFNLYLKHAIPIVVKRRSRWRGRRQSTDFSKLFYISASDHNFNQK